MRIRMGRLSDAIVEAILASGQSPAAIAKGAGLARSQLSRLLNGELGPSADSIERLADYLGLCITIEPKSNSTRKGR